MSAPGALHVIMDVDTGVDDAMALAMAVRSSTFNLLGVTTVAGNVSLKRATINTLRVLDLMEANGTPVFAGMSRPLARDHFDAAHFHGHDGLGGAPLPDSARKIEPQTAPEFIVRTAREYAGELALVFVGPLTNLAVALALEPNLPDLVERTVIMGGAFDVPGNATPHAEFNIAADPEAARIVAESGLQATWVGLDVTHSTSLYRSEWERLQDLDSPAAFLVREVCRRSFEQRCLDSVHLHDPLAVGVALNSGVVRCVRSGLWVDTSVRETAGTTRMVTDSRAREHSVAMQVDSSMFRTLFTDILELPAFENAPPGSS